MCDLCAFVATTFGDIVVHGVLVFLTVGVRLVESTQNLIVFSSICLFDSTARADDVDDQGQSYIKRVQIHRRIVWSPILGRRHRRPELSQAVQGTSPLCTFLLLHAHCAEFRFGGWVSGWVVGGWNLRVLPSSDHHVAAYTVNSLGFLSHSCLQHLGGLLQRVSNCFDGHELLLHISFHVNQTLFKVLDCLIERLQTNGMKYDDDSDFKILSYLRYLNGLVLGRR